MLPNATVQYLVHCATLVHHSYFLRVTTCMRVVDIVKAHFFFLVLCLILLISIRSLYCHYSLFHNCVDFLHMHEIAGVLLSHHFKTFFSSRILFLVLLQSNQCVSQNLPQFKNVTIPESDLKKKHSSIAYH